MLIVANEWEQRPRNARYDDNMSCISFTDVTGEMYVIGHHVSLVRQA